MNQHKFIRPWHIHVLFIDIIALSLTFYAVVSLLLTPDSLFNIDNIPSTEFAWMFLVYTVSFLITLLAVGLYNEKAAQTINYIALRAGVATALALMLSASLYLLFPLNFWPAFSWVLLLGAGATTLILARIAIRPYYHRLQRTRVAVVGTGKNAKMFKRLFRNRSSRIHFELIGFLDIGDGQCADSIYSIGSVSDIEDIIKNKDIDELVIALDDRRQSYPTDLLMDCRLNGINVIDINDFIEREVGMISIEQIKPCSFIYYKMGNNNLLMSFSSWLWNSFLASIVFLTTWPILLITVIAIKIEDGIHAPIFYRQTRTGISGKPFEIIKFRSMITDAEKNKAVMSTNGDPRITKVGKFIRTYRIDELPQIINVFKGQMNFVGPRPERPEFTDSFDERIPYYRVRTMVKPGLTGWAQLNYPYGDCIEDTIEKLKYDLYYLRHRRITFDIYILVNTCEVILFGKGR
uniref:TIGR03013 family XrtA/PEP-CTERM system glycosyltransferase n=1 Tax=Thaumasiovibrio occultus TaxID=1891184 RepID=UPI000B3522C4|nr:TIGR03013 family XrtA/PEP-CTERM system glycosyltransferase [Thaumasiovibrio occultus]